MRIGLAWIINPEIGKFNNMSNQFEANLNEYFAQRDYGDGIKEICIGILCDNPPPGFEKFGEPRRPKYTYEYKTYTRGDVSYTIGRKLEYDIKLDFETFKNATNEEASRILAEEILNSLTVFDKMKKKIKDFDSELFKKDLEQYFKEKDWSSFDIELKNIEQKNQVETAKKQHEVPEEVTAALKELQELNRNITPESLSRISELFGILEKHRQQIEKEKKAQTPINKASNNFSNQTEDDKWQIIKKLTEFQSRPKFENGFHYPDTDNKSLYLKIQLQYSRVVDDLIVAINRNADEKELQKVIKNGLFLFKDEKYTLDTEDRKQICLYFENIMDIIGLESSGGALNEWMYGFDTLCSP